MLLAELSETSSIELPSSSVAVDLAEEDVTPELADSLCDGSGVTAKHITRTANDAKKAINIRLSFLCVALL